MWRHADRERIADLLKYLVVGVGGFLGAVARYIVATYIGSRYGVRFPYGTFVINMSGCFLIGLIVRIFLNYLHAQSSWQNYLQAWMQCHKGNENWNCN